MRSLLDELVEVGPAKQDAAGCRANLRDDWQDVQIEGRLRHPQVASRLVSREKRRFGDFRWCRHASDIVDEPFRSFGKRQGFLDRAYRAVERADEEGNVLVERDWRDLCDFLLGRRDFVPRHRHHRLTARRIAKAVEFERELALHTARVYADYCGAETIDGPRLVDATPLREALPATFTKPFREEMESKGVSRSTLYEIRKGKRVRLETFNRVADAHGCPELCLRPSALDVPTDLPIGDYVPAYELVLDVMVAGTLLQSTEALQWAKRPDPDWETFFRLPEEVRTFAIEYFHRRGREASEAAREWRKVKAPITPERVWTWRSRSVRPTR